MLAISFAVALSNFGHLKPFPSEFCAVTHIMCSVIRSVLLLPPVLFWESVLTVGRKPELDSWSAGLSEPRKSVLGPGLSELAVSVCPLEAPSRCAATWVFLRIRVHLQLRAFQSPTDFALCSRQVCWLCVVLIYRFSFRENACKVLNFENYTFNFRNFYVNVLKVF